MHSHTHKPCTQHAHAFMCARAFTCEIMASGVHSVYTRAYTRVHACLHTHTHTRTFPHHQHLAQWLTRVPAVLERKQLGDKARLLGLLVRKGSEVPNGTQMSGSAEPPDLARDTQHCPAASPARPSSPSPHCPSGATACGACPGGLHPQAGTHSPQGAPAGGGDMQPRVVPSRGLLGAAENGAVTSGDSGLHQAPHRLMRPSFWAAGLWAGISATRSLASRPFGGGHPAELPMVTHQSYSKQTCVGSDPNPGTFLPWHTQPGECPEHRGPGQGIGSHPSGHRTPTLRK